MTSCCPRPRMRWSGATGAIARCKNRSTGYARRTRSVPAWRWICGVKPTPKAVNKPLHHFIVHGLDKPGSSATVSIQTLIDDQHAIAHNKVMVIDSTTMLTGSFNFTKAAEERNAENLVVIKDAPELVRAYEANVQAHAAHAHPYARSGATVSSSATPVADARGEVHGNR